MNQLKDIDKMSVDTFLATYLLKEELIEYCRQKSLPTSGGKIEITKRIAFFKETGKILKATSKGKNEVAEISREALIPENIGFSEELRAFFKQALGNDFRFHVPFQRWLKANAGKTLQEAIEIYPNLNSKSQQIDKQFEYNTYIRDFYQNTQGYQLKDAIKCWNYKKRQAGKHIFDIHDLHILDFD